MPLSVSGVDERGFKRLNGARQAPRRSHHAVPGASANAVDPADPAEIVPGGNFAAALSYGDVTIGGVGTTSYVCDDRAIAFGHPLFAFGATSASASVANALTIVGDATWRPLQARDDRRQRRRSRPGSPGRDSHAARDDAELDPDQLEPHVPGHGSLTRRTVRRGARRTCCPTSPSSTCSATSTACRTRSAPAPGGSPGRSPAPTRQETPWSLERQDVFASEFDLSIETSFAVADEIAALNFYRDKGAEIDDIHVEGSVEQTYRTLRIAQRARAATNGVYRPAGDEITARPGRLVRLQVILKQSTGGPNRVAYLRVRMPERPRFTTIEISGGSLEEFCEEEVCEGPETLAELLEDLRSKRPHNVLVGQRPRRPRGVERSVDTRTFGASSKAAVDLRRVLEGQAVSACLSSWARSWCQAPEVAVPHAATI